MSIMMPKHIMFPVTQPEKCREIDVFQHAHDMLIAVGTYQRQPPYKKQTLIQYPELAKVDPRSTLPQRLPKAHFN